MRYSWTGSAKRNIKSDNHALDIGTAILEQGVPGMFVVHSGVYAGLLDLQLIEFIGKIVEQQPTFLGKTVVVHDKGTICPATWAQIFEEHQ